MKHRHIGQLLAAHPINPQDELSQSVILMITFTEELSLGIQINRPAMHVSIQSVAASLGIWWEGNDPLYLGGRMHENRIHVVHSLDWMGLSSIQINEDLAVTNDISVLSAISQSQGPEFFRACAGHWTWEHGQLEKQLYPSAEHPSRHNWEIAPATLESVFEHQGSDQWRKTLVGAGHQRVAEWF